MGRWRFNLPVRFTRRQSRRRNIGHEHRCQGLAELTSPDMEENVEIATKRGQCKDADGNLTMQVTHSKNPLKEFPDTAYRKRSSDFDPTAPIELENRDVPPHHMLQAISFVIYELNKFGSAATTQDAKECQIQISATTSIDCNLRRATSIVPLIRQLIVHRLPR